MISDLRTSVQVRWQKPQTHIWTDMRGRYRWQRLLQRRLWRSVDVRKRSDLGGDRSGQLWPHTLRPAQRSRGIYQSV